MRHEIGSRNFKRGSMKIYAISDLHLSINNPKPMDIFGDVWENYVEKIFDNWRKTVGQEDVVLLAGDFSWAMKLEDAVADFEMMKDLPGKKVIIRGNHDYWWKSISAVRKILPENFYAVQNDCVKFENVIICGTRGWTVPENEENQTQEDKKIYNREVLRLEMTLQSAKNLKNENDRIICMMHYPPTNFKKDDSDFTNLMASYGVDAVVFGHLHGGKKSELRFVKNNIPYYLTSCDKVYNELVEII